jgi:hypothetical protein
MPQGKIRALVKQILRHYQDIVVCNDNNHVFSSPDIIFPKVNSPYGAKAYVKYRLVLAMSLLEDEMPGAASRLVIS